jgi:hypothetical protein
MYWPNTRLPVTMSCVDVVIVNWNSGDQLRRCLASLAAASGVGTLITRVLVMDNDSTDRSLGNLESSGLPVEIVRGDTNMGFGKACNLGASRCSSDLVLFLNPDVSVAADCLERAVCFTLAPEHADIGVVGVQLRDERGNVSRTCARFPSPGGFLIGAVGLDRMFPNLFLGHFMREWDHRSDRVVDQVMGAFFLTRRRLFEQVHGFDPRFFMYYEEVDYSLRLYRLGFKTAFLAGVHALHVGGSSSRSIPTRRLYYSLQSRILYARKHFTNSGCLAVLVATLLIEFPVRLAWAGLTLAPRSLGATVIAYVMLWRDLVVHRFYDETR